MNKADLIDKVSRLLSNETNEYIKQLLITLNARDIARSGERAKRQREYHREYYKEYKNIK